MAEWDTYVAVRRIFIGRALAFNIGDPVPLSHVQSGIVSLDDVALAPDVPPPPIDVFDERVADLIAADSATREQLGAAFVAGRVLNSNGSVNTQKKLTVKLTADGLDIEDLIIEDVA